MAELARLHSPKCFDAGVTQKESCAMLNGSYLRLTLTLNPALINASTGLA